ncbi:hypothetical protein [Phenylobacterium sp.]|jgi:hypothetical protein|uniref:hypothetical protein n=1 Tax=Phenylobacterium sp. TaxID=1871053 RepID=UPI000C8B7794|nr:hypothetical protein [Phenylobacterium sp.]MAK81336.1 hypothetical protein [Phenylobacterium sp.]|tara:strand:+ start:852 stop:1343 length:492 start_codon:yes stop_codon:yes gene_type:complete
MFKRLETIWQADPYVAGTTGRDGTAPLTLEEQHDWVASIQLPAQVPAEVVRSFDTARNAFLYAWFSYDLSALAEGQAFRTVELALRLRLGARAHPKDTFAPLMEKAVADGFLKELAGGPPLALGLRMMRNDRAHPSSTVLSPALTLQTLELCAAVISQLYASP